MKATARYVLILFAVLFVAGVWWLWKKEDRKRAETELRLSYGAEISITDSDFTLGCSSEKLTDLVDLARLALRVGKPTILDVTGAPNLVSFEGVQQLTSLRSLIAVDCPQLVSAKGVASHPSLVELALIDSARVEDLGDVRDLPRLHTLDVSGCAAVAGLELGTLRSMENLYLSRCARLEKLDLTGLSQLKRLYLDGCSNLTEVTGWDSLTSLTDLDLSHATRLPVEDFLGQLGGLEFLDVREVPIQDFSAVSRMTKLNSLRLGGQDSLTSLLPFAALEALTSLHVEACPNLESLEGLPVSLTQYAGFVRCPKLTTLNGIGRAVDLEQLDVRGCEALADVSALSELHSLMQLNLGGCKEVTDISPVLALERIMIVMLGGSGVTPESVEKWKPKNEELVFDFSVSS